MADRNDNIGELLSETKSGGDRAFNDLVKLYQPLIAGCVARFSSKGDCDELEQEALIALYRAACTYQPGQGKVSFGLYAKICINNSLISFLRTVSTDQSNSTMDEEMSEEIIGDSDPSENLINDENFHRLDQFVKNNLSSYEYRVFHLYIEGYKIREIADILQKSEKSAEGAMQRLRIKLRQHLHEFDL